VHFRAFCGILGKVENLLKIRENMTRDSINFLPYKSNAPCRMEMVGMDIAMPRDQLFKASRKAAWFIVG
jgi:hypothetical protein